ncbi:hypothetical protein F2Q69_00009594 [Brassica cretica]|uniref:Uncharacterized protein n=1 Tax=Brassica cretica TaxID=69181 RepID=A0A8S9P131_BRACR|nr:hypothetical protein F2Q69_00009594 [Brassica cretica]
MHAVTVAEETIAEDGSCLEPEIGVPDLIAIAGAPFQSVATRLSLSLSVSFVLKVADEMRREEVAGL